MTRTILTATLVILGVTACLRPTQRGYSIQETRTRHVRGTPNQSFPELPDAK